VDDLQRRFRDGEPDAVRAVYRRYGGAVHTVAWSIVGDDLAADVVQQTFLKAWRASATFDADRDLAPWLYGIARRTAIDVLRSERSRAGHAREAEVGVESLSMERTWEVFEVRRAVDDLPAVEREVVRLSHFEGWTHAQIAERLGVPVGTVKSRSARAHGRLAAALAHLFEPRTTPAASGVEASEDLR